MDETKLVFIPLGGPLGFFIEESRHDFMERFNDATATAVTWGEFLGRFSADEAAFLLCFTECDMVQPKPDDTLGSLRDHLYIFNDMEFPMIQLADETYALLAPLGLDPIGDFEIYTTEYGVPIGMFETSRIDEMADQLRKHGFIVK